MKTDQKEELSWNIDGQFLLKRGSDTWFSCEFCEIF